MKTPLSKIWLRCTICALLIGLQACDNSPYVTEILLRSNFDEDGLGDNPEKTLPGDPVGDELLYSDQADLSVIHTEFSGGEPNALLQIFSASQISHVLSMSRPSSFSGIVRFSWNGRLVDWVNVNQQLHIFIDDGYGKALAHVVIVGQSLYIMDKDDQSWYNGDYLGTPFIPLAYPPRGIGNAATDHVFIFEVNFAQKKFDLILAGQHLTQNVFKYNNLPIFDPGIVLSANTRPMLRIFGWTVSANPCGYVTDNVIISRKFISIPDVDL